MAALLSPLILTSITCCLLPSLSLFPPPPTIFLLYICFIAGFSKLSSVHFSLRGVGVTRKIGTMLQHRSKFRDITRQQKGWTVFHRSKGKDKHSRAAHKHTLLLLPAAHWFFGRIVFFFPESAHNFFVLGEILQFVEQRTSSQPVLTA